MLKKLIFNCIYGYKLEEDIPEINDRLVVAGDPACNIDTSFREISLPVNDAALVSSLDEYEVTGFSMYPCGISDRDHIYVQRGFNNRDLSANDFIMIKVNQEDYSDEKVHFNHKLRRFLMNVKSTESLDDIVSKLKIIQPEILLDSYKTRLAKKFSKSNERYGDVNEFSLSFTFKNGVMSYSFHPTEDIEGRVEYVYSREKKALRQSREFEPYS